MDLAAIDPVKLPSLPLEKKADLPDCPAIYFAISSFGENPLASLVSPYYPAT